MRSHQCKTITQIVTNGHDKRMELAAYISGRCRGGLESSETVGITCDDVIKSDGVLGVVTTPDF